MSTLDDIFPDAKEHRDAQVVLDDHHTMRRLDQLFGDRRADLDLTHRASSRPALVSLVNQAAADAKPTRSASPGPQGKQKPVRRRIDLLNVGVVALAVVAVVTAGVVGGMQAATASPASEALGVLTADERTISSVEARLVEGQTQIADDIAAADAQAAALRTALEAVREAPDPEDIPPGQSEPPADAGTIPIADGKALDAALAAVDGYRKDLAAVEPPSLPDAYKRKSMDKGSLTSVAAAIDAAQLQLTELDRATASAREVRAAVQSRGEAFASQLKTFTATFVPTTQAAIDDNPDAGQDVKDALTVAAGAVAAADLTTPDGLATLSGYRTALIELVADQVHQDRVRADQLREEERRREQQQNPPRNSTPDPSPTPTPTDPSDQGADPAADLGSPITIPEG
ncbi:hypothetical protein QF046_001442 [Microbacterium sp. W4I4]|uniref:hypothetical protein n=1 Tax=Microbacterium sp. W4I4 TaxID=3042295 RepID=UPI002787768B|nr:hypothetical protein [Microbacterium sp. W4I4]MDQ0613801.1 hypothetical protein [Microbacterium sp. W4I4]